ncbi:DUF934 domain-containing protein [Rhodoplanes serenus]|jgi:uncharacterized protein (DUF934 family)|uniref:DUF934 domain-containing protein n=1 Tax=Rhodoplanes serenus TaxID=200615 RepID=UPI000DACE2CA|nr:DUF934 domain-containing protein [Rhodoplanes serenus]MBI5114297.1 DUF934 domain-containing protein [Rhodovulum sp.]RAI32851.1 oxidoreductase [Rhodoplanes serenus]
MPLYRSGAFVTDDWTFLTDDTPLPATGAVGVSRTRFLAERDALLGRTDPVGVMLTAGDTLAGIVPDLPRLALIALRFPKYGDGRPYSLARLLRERHGYRGELRAIGDVLHDQIPLMRRCGFDAFEVTHPGTVAALRDQRVVAVRHHYQPASAEASEIRPESHPWRRVSAPHL